MHATRPCGMKRLDKAPAPRTAVVRNASAMPSKPIWTGESFPSKLANWAISTPWMYSIMKVLAKDQMKRTAKSKGVQWDDYVSKLQTNSELETIKQQMERKDIQYPSYYLKPFHAYDEGNLNWLAAYEVEPATYCVALRTYGKLDPSLTGEGAYARLAGNATNALREFCARHGLSTAPATIVDAGCSIGMSTRWLASQFPGAEITGMDLSPYFLAVAEWKERQRSIPQGGRRIKYVQDRADAPALADGSVDWLLFQYVIHECPQHAIRSFIAAGARVVKPSGVLMFVDNNPRSKTIQGLDPAIATLMKSTEPWSDEYFSFDVEAAMVEGGFKEVVTVEIDHRHRAVMGIKA